MSNPKLKRLLASVGMGVFVRCFREFTDDRLTNAEVAGRLPHEYTLKSRLSRTSHARAIIRRGLVSDALQMISNSRRADAETVRRASQLANTFTPSKSW